MCSSHARAWNAYTIPSMICSCQTSICSQPFTHVEHQAGLSCSEQTLLVESCTNRCSAFQLAAWIASLFEGKSNINSGSRKHGEHAVNNQQGKTILHDGRNVLTSARQSTSFELCCRSTLPPKNEPFRGAIFEAVLGRCQVQEA